MKKLLFFLIIMSSFKMEPAQIFDDNAPDGGKQEIENQELSGSREFFNKYQLVSKYILKNCSVDDSKKITKIIKEYDQIDEAYEKYLRENKDKSCISQEQWNKNNQELIEAAKNNNESRTKELLESGEINVDSQDEEGYSALIYSTKKGNINIARLLIKHKANVNAKDYEYGYTCLMQAVLKGDLRMVKFLLDNGAKVNDINYSEATALYLACLPPYYNKDIIKILLEYDAEINEHVLKIADHEILNLLSNYKKYLCKKVLISAHLNDQLTSLVNDYDVSYSQLEINTSELIKAVENNTLSRVKELLESEEVYIDAQNHQGWTPLMIAASKPACFEIAKLLLEHKATVNLKTKEGFTALSIAAFSSDNNVKTIILLLTNGADINCKSDSGVTPLMGALEKGNLDIVRLLLIYGANIHDLDGIGNTILMNVIFHYSWHQVSDIIKMILSKDIDINIQNNCKITALMFAANKSLEMVKLLTAKGAKLDLKNKFGNTALDYARNSNQDEIVEYLENLMAYSSSSSSS